MKTTPHTALHRAAAPLAISALAAALGGCAFGDSTSYNRVRADPTPELMTLGDRPVDISNQVGVTMHENRRMFWQDLQRFVLLDRPSRLTPEPMPH